MKYDSSALYVSFSNDGRYLATTTDAYECAVSVWDLEKNKLAGPILRHTGAVRSVQFDSRRVESFVMARLVSGIVKQANPWDAQWRTVLDL
jgi:WD40 repeat protein